LRRKWLVLILLLFVLAATITLILHSYKNFRVQEGFSPLPLSFDPYSSTSTYDWKGSLVSIQGGFVKGKLVENNKTESLLLRALSPTPSITIKGSSDTTVNLRLENVSLSKIKFGNDITNLKAIDPQRLGELALYSHKVFFC